MDLCSFEHRHEKKKPTGKKLARGNNAAYKYVVEQSHI